MIITNSRSRSPIKKELRSINIITRSNSFQVSTKWKMWWRRQITRKKITSWAFWSRSLVQFTTPTIVSHQSPIISSMTGIFSLMKGSKPLIKTCKKDQKLSMFTIASKTILKMIEIWKINTFSRGRKTWKTQCIKVRLSATHSTMTRSRVTNWMSPILRIIPSFSTEAGVKM